MKTTENRYNKNLKIVKQTQPFFCESNNSRKAIRGEYKSGARGVMSLRAGIGGGVGRGAGRTEDKTGGCTRRCALTTQ